MFILILTLLFIGLSMAEPFSFKEIQGIPNITSQKPQFVPATDGIQLAYYPFLPKSEPENILVFYHGGGAYINTAYQWVGQQLQQQNIGIYMVDIRGHGHSQGPRGDAPSIEQVWVDIDTLLDFVHQKHPNAKLYLAGHSSGAGLILNYGAWKPHNRAVGYLCFAPFLGPQSGTIREFNPLYESFSKSVHSWVYLIGGITGGRLCAHTPAVYFNYPQEILNKDPLMLPYYTYTMSCATTPYETEQIFQKLEKPVALYIGLEDEQLLPQEVVEYKYAALKVAKRSHAQIIAGAKHLSILLEVPRLVDEVLTIFNK